jgi:hypothetical protein
MDDVVYISGPMAGIPELNYPAFFRAEKHIVALGYEVENPARNPEPPCKSWEGYMRLSIIQLMRCRILVRLPGWDNSNGANMENEIAQRLNFKIFDLHTFLGLQLHKNLPIVGGASNA